MTTAPPWALPPHLLERLELARHWPRSVAELERQLPRVDVMLASPDDPEVVEWRHVYPVDEPPQPSLVDRLFGRHKEAQGVPVL